ncbi:MAG: S41 family peptidase [Planctomycetes bacterium]|nr:S41 family peptidase [Planctomycetota bacterium]
MVQERLNRLYIALFPGFLCVVVTITLVKIDNLKFNPFLRGIYSDASDSAGEFELYKAVKKEVLTHGIEDVSPDELLTGALNGVVSSVDRYSAFYTNTEYEEQFGSLNESFVGMGVQISEHPDLPYITIVTPIRGSPAFDAGCQSGDLIESIDDESSRGMTLNQANVRLTGKIDSVVRLGLLRWESATRDFTKKVEVTIKRRNIPQYTVDGTRMLDLENEIGYVRIEQFGYGTAAEVRDALVALISAGMKKLVLDLRLNGGGSFQNCRDIGDMLIDSGVLVSTLEKDETGRPQVTSIEAKPEATIFRGPMAVIVNSHSASASEVLTGMLQDYERAVVVGLPTYGKGKVQSLIQKKVRMPDGEILDFWLKLTTSKYITPAGRMIDQEEFGRRLIHPDVLVPVTDDEMILVQRNWRNESIFDSEYVNDHPYELSPDRQLESAVRILRGERVYSRLPGD